MLFTNDYRKSLVDDSPIANLSNEQVNHLEDAIDAFDDYDFVSRFEVKSFEDRQDIYKMCSMYWHKSEPFGGLNISIYFYKDEQAAVKSFQRYVEGKYTLITNGNDAEAILFDSEMDRAGHGVPVSNRYLLSKLRFGNAIITLSESPEQHQLHMNISSDFIKLLCEMLSQK